MRVARLTPAFFAAALWWVCGASANDAGNIRIERIDGSTISATEIEEYLPAWMESAGVTGLQMAVINGDRVAYEGAWGKKSRASDLVPDRATVFPGLSFSKPAFACLVMRLVENGALEWDRPLVEYLDRPIGEFADWKELEDEPGTREITARRVLTHTTGWPNFRAQMEGGKLGHVFPPGERFSYSGEGFQFLQFVVEHVTGRSLDVLAREMMFEPLGMSRTSYIWDAAFEANHADGHTEGQRRIKLSRRAEASAAGSLLTTASDFAKLILAVLHHRGFERYSIDRMLSPQVGISSKRMFGPMANEETEANGAINLSWGLGWGLFDTGFGRAFFHTGHDVGWENYTVAYLDKKIGVVLLSNSSNFESIAERIVRRVIGDDGSPFAWLGYQPFDPSVPPPPPEPERKTVPIDHSIFDAVAGRYEVQPGNSVILKVEDGRLLGSGDGNSWNEVLAVSDTVFFIDGKPYDFTFRRGPDHAVNGMIIFYEGMEIPAEKID